MLMKNRYNHLLINLLFIVLVNINSNAQILSVSEIEQEKDQWCWNGVSKCVLDYYGIFEDQCKIAEYARSQNNSHFGNTNCCDSPEACNNWNWMWGDGGSIEQAGAGGGADVRAATGRPRRAL